MSTEDELRNCRQGKRILKKRVAELERELAVLKRSLRRIFEEAESPAHNNIDDRVEAVLDAAEQHRKLAS
ncbi:MAG TPA: hypothetical protein VGS01_09615 [Candidatus Limnocylindria bacterium]|jgi:hypothetical protein|nr:hypothetical protein [Candidatus Limnocylindria bacterium]